MTKATEYVDPKLFQFCTVRQLEILEAINSQGSIRGAAKFLKVDQAYAHRVYKSVKEKAAAVSGYSPEDDMTRPIGPGLRLSGNSTLYRRGEREPVLQWVKTKADDEERERIIREFVDYLVQDVKPLKPLKYNQPNKEIKSDLMAVIPMGDPHFGMHAWWEEAGENFDLKAAEKLTRAAVDYLVQQGPTCETALLLNLGDMFHADNQKNETKSGNRLDVDGRWRKVQQVGLQTMIYCIQRMLERYKKVIVRINSGNHDDHSAYALSMMLSCFFSDELRVQIELSPSVFWYYQFGKVLIGSAHGDTTKAKDMLPIMATDKPKEWGETEYRYWYMGHVHHQDVIEERGGVVEYFRTLAARDAWHHGQGYRAGRDMRLIVLHKERGEVERHRCDIATIK